MPGPLIPDPPYPHGPGRASGSVEKRVEARQASNFCFPGPCDPSTATYLAQNPTFGSNDLWLAEALAAAPLPTALIEALLGARPAPARRSRLALPARSADARCADLACVYVFTTKGVDASTHHLGGDRNHIEPVRHRYRPGRRLLIAAVFVFAPGCSAGRIVASIGESLPGIVAASEAYAADPVVTFHGIEIGARADVQLGETVGVERYDNDETLTSWPGLEAVSRGARPATAAEAAKEEDPRARSKS